MGGDIKWMITGSAAAPTWLLEFYQSIGLLLLEAYGVTENPVPMAANRPEGYRFGSVGKPFAGNDIRIADDGEVLVNGPAMFRGYRGEQRDAAQFTSDGYYRTGDLGRFDADGFLYLTGRVADIIKTSNGRRISPVAVEGVYTQSRYIDQMIVLGNNRPFLVGLVSVNTVSVRAALGLADDASVHERAHADAVVRLIEAEIASLADRLPNYERVRAFRLLPGPLSVERGELTPTLKLRRNQIQTIHADLIDSMYTDVVAAHGHPA
jgi:long-chain acyl-CoA synthetase